MEVSRRRRHSVASRAHNDNLHVDSQVMFFRKTYGSRLNIFAPVNDLSLLSRSGTEDKSLVAGQKNDVEITGGQLLGDEYSDHVVKVSFFRATCTTRTHHLPQNRSGIILRETYVIRCARVYAYLVSMIQHASQVRPVAVRILSCFRFCPRGDQL